MPHFRFRPRYGLRTLFALTLLCSLGAAWWTRPYQVPRSEASAGLDWCGCYVGSDIDEYGRDYTVVDTMRRGLWGGPVRHGPSTLHDTDGRLRMSTDYRHGRLNGLVRKWDEHGQLRVQEQWRDSLEHGTWREWDNAGVLEEEAEYRDGQCLRRTELPAKWGSLVVYEYAADGDPDSVPRCTETRWNADKTVRRES